MSRPTISNLAQILSATSATRQPANGATPMRGPEARRAATHAAAAFAKWSRCTGETRAAILERAADLVEGRRAYLGALMAQEVAATPLWQSFNLDQAVWQLREAARLARHLASGASDSITGSNRVYREPVGVCLAIAPWNAPIALGVRGIATALACGNSVILKASEISVQSHLAIADILRDAGLPDGVLTVVTHTPEHAEEVVRSLIGHEVVRRVNFTGSTRVGRQVATIAAQHLKRCLLALSGKASAIVLEDADLDAAADAVALGAFLNQGQVCMSTDRVIVVEPVADAFAARLTERSRMWRKTLRPDDTPSVGTFQLGPMISEASAQRVEDIARDAQRLGAHLLCGGKRHERYMEATVLDRVAPGMRAYGEELFGPLVAICRASGAEEAVSIANDCRYGLSTAIWSRDIPQALSLSRQIETGMCHINAPTVLDRPDMPAGGVKESGYGRFGADASLDEFTELRWVSIG